LNPDLWLLSSFLSKLVRTAEGLHCATNEWHEQVEETFGAFTCRNLGNLDDW